MQALYFHIPSTTRMGAHEPSRKPPRKDEATVVKLDAAFLDRLGERVREARARRGMTRKILARDSGVSERYLAQLETGRGNASVLLLRQIAQALNLPVDELVRADDGQSVELTLIFQLLKRLPAAKLARVRTQLVREYGTAYGARENRIALVGLRGAGKSTLGAALARQLGVPFVELDHEVEAEAGTSLHEIFLLHGQAGFRRYERRALERILEKNERCIIATGGSIVSEPATYDLVLSACFTVWLKAAPEEHMARVAAQGDYRPMAGNREAMDDLRRILAGREPLYAQADVTIDTEGKTVEASLATLARAVTPRD
jgi:XRE family transcriptional regulator, aerobic/anaerobic benzoate catabolism transcriptional regulator